MSQMQADDAGLSTTTIMDAGIGAPLIELGTGDLQFTKIVANTELPLVLGPQGTGRIEGYHVWGAVRTTALDGSQRINLNFSIERVSDGAQMAMSQWEKKLQPTREGHVFYALPIILFDCCEARGQMLKMSVLARDANAKSAEAAIEFRAGPSCGDVDGREICP